MSRFKFRFWDYKQMIYNPFITDGSDGGETAYVSINDGCMNMDGILMQYTGANDSEGNPIYESDIIKFTDADSLREFTSAVYFDNVTLGFAVDLSIEKNKSRMSWLCGVMANYDSEVIGNIYQNNF